MVLDTEGKNLDSERPWPQNALLVVDRETRTIRETPAYYAFRHFSGVVAAGATRVGLTGAFENAAAFRNPDGRLAVVTMNAENRRRTLTIGTRRAVLELELPAYGWATVTF
jgi:glucosylceramidase